MRAILLADTDPDVRRILRDYLGASGFEVRPCGSVDELLARVELDRPAAVILELYDLAPGAEDLVRHLRAGPAGEPVPVIAFTSSPRRSLLREVEAAGAVLVVKPASPQAVLRALERALATGPSGSPIGDDPADPPRASPSTA